jgi:pimeloyl-ACP methyl ester carboxylesterase
MERQHLYFTILILGILIGSSLYLSWSVDRGMGAITVERVSLEREPGRPVEILVYQPRPEALGGFLEPMPVILSLHGTAGSKEGMYAFNIELARRNFTVVSVDLPGHGDSTLPFIVDDVEAIAQDAYYALRHVQTTFPYVHNESYGIIAHSFGFRVGVELYDYPIAPLAFAAVGDFGRLESGEYLGIPGNLLIALGQYDSTNSENDALNAIRDATGNLSAEAGVTYGSFENQTAYRLVMAPTDHASGAFDATSVRESTIWLLRGLQGDAQLAITLDPNRQVYFFKTIATYACSLFLIVSTIPLMMLAYISLPERFRPRKIPLKTESMEFRKTFLVSSVMGALTVIIYVVITASGFQLETIGLVSSNSTFAIGIWIYYFFTMICLLTTMRLLMGKDQTLQALSSVGIARRNLKQLTLDILKSIIIVVLPMIWFMGWLAIAGLPGKMQPYTILAILKWPMTEKVLNTIVLVILSIPFFVVEASWIRGLLLRKREWKGGHHDIKNIIFAFVAKFAVTSMIVVLVMLGSSLLGLIGWRVVLLGLLLAVILILQVISSIITTYTAIVLENTWPGVFLSAFLFAIIAMTVFPLI